MQVYTAIPISGKIFIGKVKIHRQRQYPSFPKKIDKSLVESELLKLKQAIKQLESDIKVFLLDPEVSQLDKDILSTHLMIVTDIEITQIMENAISEQLLSAPQTVFNSFEKIIRNFEQMDNSYFAQRADDYKDVAHRLMMSILGDKEQTQLQYSSDEIVFVNEITPSLVSILSRAGVKAYCTEHGSLTSHSSILSRAMGLTALVVKENIIANINDGESAILDAINSKII
ncbi:MAG: phosphoenolpyruvate-utilizing N-terminal domain-containing protein, partial [Candidatus Cloacimonadaceae bacterium]